MIRVILIAFVLAWLNGKHGIAQNIDITDANFLQTLINLGIDTNKDGKIQNSEAVTVTSLTVSNLGISNLGGIEAFVNLDTLNCSSNQLTALNLQQNTKLIVLNCLINKLTSLDVSKNKSLNTLHCSNNKLTSLKVSDNPQLKILDCGFNKLTSLDITAAINLEILECYSNQLDSLNLLKNTHLTDLYCSNNQIRSLDLSESTDLKTLDCQFNKLIHINLSKNVSLSRFACFSNQLETLDITKNKRLVSLDCGLNLYTSLDLSKCDSLQVADCSQNPNLLYICVKDTVWAKANINFYKDKSAQWTQHCTLTNGVNDGHPANSIQVIPNPSSTCFNLALQQPASIQIFNSTGVEVENFAHAQNLQFGQGYRPGLYIVHISFPGNKGRKMVTIIKN